MSQIVIDATDAVFGRLCSYAAKKALEGNEVIIINSEKAVISGDKQRSIEKYSNLKSKGGFSQKGPKYSRVPYKMLKRGIRGMLPDFRMGIGKKALTRIMCYEGVPKEFENKKTTSVKSITGEKYIQLKELSSKI